MPSSILPSLVKTSFVASNGAHEKDQNEFALWDDVEEVLEDFSSPDAFKDHGNIIRSVYIIICYIINQVPSRVQWMLRERKII